jgi:hypothetical protein
MAQGEEARLGGTGAAAVAGEVLHAALKVRDRDLRKLRRHLLVGPVLDGVAGQLLPVPRPIDAELTVAVVHE